MVPKHGAGAPEPCQQRFELHAPSDGHKRAALDFTRLSDRTGIPVDTLHGASRDNPPPVSLCRTGEDLHEYWKTLLVAMAVVNDAVTAIPGTSYASACTRQGFRRTRVSCAQTGGVEHLGMAHQLRASPGDQAMVDNMKQFAGEPPFTWDTTGA